MERIREFLFLRYSLVEESQGVLDSLPLPSPKGEAVIVAINQEREFSVNGVSYSFVGFSAVEPTENSVFPEGRFWMGKLAKLRQAHVGRKVPGDIVETREDDWQPVLAIFDLQRQFIVVETDWRFGTSYQTIRALQGGLRQPILRDYNHSIFVEGCVRKEHFWNIVESHQKIYKLEVKLISPNILETNLSARDALKALKDLFGQDQIKINLINEQGELSIPQNPINDYIEYIQEGEGTWSVTTEGDHGGKKTHSSTDNIDKVEVVDSIPDGGVAGNEDPNYVESRDRDATVVSEIFRAIRKNYE